jgi:hypothetical protein
LTGPWFLLPVLVVEEAVDVMVAEATVPFELPVAEAAEVDVQSPDTADGTDTPFAVQI